MAFLQHRSAIRRQNIHHIIHRNRPLPCKMIVTGIDIGIPLNLISNVFTNLHYGYDVTSIKVVLLHFLIGYYTYGKDRYKDALEYEETPIETSKQNLYKSILQYRHIYKFTYCISFYLIAGFLIQDDSLKDSLPILCLLYTTEYYKSLKQNTAFLKPFYVSFMWSFATVILPCFLHDHNYEILSDGFAYLPCAFNLFALTNLADIKDLEEDSTNGIRTFPVRFGEETTFACVYLSLLLSSLLFGLHPHYTDRPLINGLFELQNACISLLCFGYQNNSKIQNHFRN